VIVAYPVLDVGHTSYLLSLVHNNVTAGLVLGCSIEACTPRLARNCLVIIVVDSQERDRVLQFLRLLQSVIYLVLVSSVFNQNERSRVDAAPCVTEESAVLGGVRCSHLISRVIHA
jgi:hypothetical protein